MEDRKEIFVTKETGEKAVFNKKKFLKSLKYSKLKPEAIEEIAGKIESELYDGIPTRDIRYKAITGLKQHPGASAARYRLKNSIMDLGPSGYPFEKYFSEILKSEGYSVKVGKVVKGKCVNHEVDIIAIKDHQALVVECKFRTSRQNKTNVQVPLYVKARFDDLKAVWEDRYPKTKPEGWLVTNNRFTSDALKYGKCAGLKLVGWNYPSKGNLKELVDRSKLYPITCLTSLTNHEKQRLLDDDIVLCRTLMISDSYLKSLNIVKSRLKSVHKELDALCSHK